MSDRPKFFDDLAGVAGGAMSAFAGLREEIAAAVRVRVDEAVRKLDLIRRDEFEAIAELARRARVKADALELRVAALEAAAVPPVPAPAETVPLDALPEQPSAAEPASPPPHIESGPNPEP